MSRRPSSTESPIAGPTLPQPRRLTSAPTTQRLRKAVDGSSVGANVHAKTRALGRLAWIGSAVVMFVLATARLSWPAMWQDELATWGMAGVSWDAMPALLNQADLVLGPYYYVIRAWAEVFGTSDLALRMPSVLAMTAAAAGVAVLGTRLANPRVGFTAGLLFAVLPVTSRYAHEARPYALAICLAVFATLVLVESCSGRQRRARVARFAPYALLVALLGLVHAVALSLLVAHLAMVWVLQRRLVPAWMVAAAVGAAPGATLLYLGHRQRSQIAWIELARWDDLLAYPGMLFGGLALIGAAMVALALLGTSARQPGVLFTAWATLPVLAIFAVAWFTPLWTTRYLLFTVPAWALLGGLALGRTHLARAVLAVAVIAAIGIPAQVEQRDTDGHSQATRDVAAIIDRAAQPGDGWCSALANPARTGSAGISSPTTWRRSDARPTCWCSAHLEAAMCSRGSVPNPVPAWLGRSASGWCGSATTRTR
ncbi:glycosyltransferase family 39 protein [Aeromicrobium sp.]|uniref:glycosyltransferase family 39 protein n=1 Tax=Aeromicrobium sp. TaxID=1871063 RepID=UPI003D6A4A8B